MSTPTHFKRRLASELSAMAATEAAPTATRAPARRPRVRFTIAAGIAAAAAAAVVVPTVSGSGSSPAYAVTRQDDGSLILEMRRAEGAPGLQRQLNKMGVRAAVLEGDAHCATGAPSEAPGSHDRYPMTFSDSEPSWQAHIHPDLIHDGETLLIVAESEDDGTTRAVSSRLVTKVPACSVPGIGGGPDAHA
ncbi:hypothetical protein ACFY93_13285 [Streptomyces sp. NPDC008313]|uniref:hypothetical protein n=1 Tax=Streptomyces sp. NPDC008313 TaxID=3364826 RepID=UPI0036E1A9C0